MTLCPDPAFLDLRTDCYALLDDLLALPTPPTAAGEEEYQRLSESLQSIIDGAPLTHALVHDLMRVMWLVSLLTPVPETTVPMNRADRRALARLQRRAS